MGPSSDFRQQRLPLDTRKPVAYRPPWMPSNTPEHADALRMVRDECRRLEDQRARCIESTCANYRTHGSIRLENPTTDPRLHLLVNGRCVGVFVTGATGETTFCEVKG